MQSANDLIAGTVSGLLCTMVEHPADTVKTRMQQYGGTYRHGLRRLVSSEGMLGFYRGLPARIGASGLEHGLTFGGYKGTLRLVGADERNPAMWQIVAGGVGGGAVTTAALTPFELVKCRMQVHSGRTYRNSFECARALFHEGGARAFFRGGKAMLLLEVYGTTLWCGSNDILRGCLAPEDAVDGDIGVARTVIAGGCSGVIAAVMAYPVDAVKTRIQVSNKAGSSSHSMLHAARVLVRERGWVRGLYGGFGIVALCAFPSSALVFLTFEWCRTRL